MAAARGVGQASVALAWLHRHPVIVVPIVGALKAERIDDAVAALSITQTNDEVAQLEARYTPRADGQGISDPVVLARGMDTAIGSRMSRS